ncbi:retrovirus-related pol polyprotein from transposon TNT 1-94 [Tanacetum coccineum]
MKKMEVKLDFVAALWGFAATFWVRYLLSRMYTNGLQANFVILVLFSKVSVSYLTLFGSILIIHFNLICAELCNRIYVLHIFNNLLIMIRAIPIEPNKSLVKAGISKKRISKRGPLRLKLRKLKRKPKSVVGHISMMATVTRNPSANGWYLDSGVTVHVCDSRDKFVDYQKVTGKQVIMANSDRADVCGFGNVKLKFTSGKVITLQNVYHVPSIPKCLISVSKLDEHGFKITFESRKVVISKHGVFVGKGYILGGMYRVDDSSGSVGKIHKTNVSVVEPYFETNENSVYKAFDSFKVYKVEVENQLGKRIKILRSDREGEYFTRMFDAFCEENGIKHERTSPYTPPQNGLAKWKNRTLVEMVNCVIIESRDVDFFEDKFSNDVDYSHTELVPTPSGSSRGETSTEINEPRRSIRARKEKDFGSDFFSYLVEGTQKKVTREIIFTINIDDDPKTFSESMSSHDAPLWKEAIKDEMDSILGNQTWELAELPKGVRPIGSKWVFKKKLNPDGSISAFKAILVAKGYRQKEGINYFDTHAPVARISSIRTLIVISAVKGLYIHQMDVKTAFLNGYLNEEVYMEQPKGFVIQGQENKVCRLVKSLYGLKQAPKQWHERFDTTVTSFEFQHNSADRCIYTKSTKEYTVVICLYVDDMLIIGITFDGILETKSYLSSNFKMKDLGEVDTILGDKVRRTNNQISLSQSHYISKILTKFRHLNIKECNTPFETSVKLEVNSGRAVAQLEYASVIGSLIVKSTRILEENLCSLTDIYVIPGSLGRERSKVALSIAYNSVYNGKSRHLRLRHNYVRQLVENGTLSVVYVKSCRNLAYPLTKPLTRDLVSVTTRDMGLKP